VATTVYEREIGFGETTTVFASLRNSSQASQGSKLRKGSLLTGKHISNFARSQALLRFQCFSGVVYALRVNLHCELFQTHSEWKCINGIRSPRNGEGLPRFARSPRAIEKNRRKRLLQSQSRVHLRHLQQRAMMNYVLTDDVMNVIAFHFLGCYMKGDVE